MPLSSLRTARDLILPTFSQIAVDRDLEVLGVQTNSVTRVATYLTWADVFEKPSEIRDLKIN